MYTRQLTTMALTESAERAAFWLMSSAQITSTDDEAFGALRNDYNMKDKTWTFFEPFWHTSQTVRAWLELQRVCNNEMWEDGIERAITFLNKQIINDPQTPHLHGGHLRTDCVREAGEVQKELISTTTITNGLEGIIDYYIKTNNNECFNTLKRSEHWLSNNAYDEETGFLNSFMDSKTGKFIDYCTYFADGHPEFQNKRPDVEGSAMLYLGKILNKPALSENFLRVLDFLVEDQGADGIWWNWSCNQKNPPLAHGRYNLWIAFALLNGYILSGKEKYRTVAYKTALFYRKAQQLDGAISYMTAPDLKGYMHTPCGSSVAMSALLWLRLLEFEYVPDLAKGVELSLQFLLNTQYSNSFYDENLRGAYFESSNTAPYSGFSYAKVRDIASVFGVQLISKVIAGLKKDNCNSFEQWILLKKKIIWEPWPAEKLLKYKRII